MRRILTIAILMILALSCGREEKQNANGPVPSSLKIEYGIQCGWEAYHDSIVIDEHQTRISLRRTEPAPQGLQFDTSFATPAWVLDSLRAGLNWQQFKNCQSNTFHLGYDGCDYFLNVQQDTGYHQVRFGPSDQVPNIKPFVEQLDSLFAAFAPWPPF